MHQHFHLGWLITHLEQRHGVCQSFPFGVQDIWCAPDILFPRLCSPWRVSRDAELDVLAPWMEEQDFTMTEPACGDTPSKLLRLSPRSSRRRRAGSASHHSFPDAEPSAAGGFWLQDNPEVQDADEDFAPDDATTDEDISRQV